MIDFSEVEAYYGPYSVEELDAAVAAALNPDSTPDALHTSNLITSAAVAGVQGSIASINITGTANNTGATIAAETFFYLNGALVVAKADIANGATLTEGTNYEAVTAGGLNALQSKISTIPKFIYKSTSGSVTYTLDIGNCNYVLIYKFSSSGYVTATVSCGTETINIPNNAQSGFFKIKARSTTMSVVVTDQYTANPMELMFICC